MEIYKICLIAGIGIGSIYMAFTANPKGIFILLWMIIIVLFLDKVII